MNESQFSPTGVTISKGSSVTLISDTNQTHIIDNGTWNAGSPRPKQEPGAPLVDLQFTSTGSQQLGPFATAGTFHFYCTVHPGMELTVIVK